MANQFVNKVVFGGKTLIDLSADTVSPETVLSGQTFHDKSGALLDGACTFDSDTSSATAAVAEILEGKTAYARGAKIVGTMPNNGATHLAMETLGPVKIPQGYHDGSGDIDINVEDKAKLIAKNIREGIEILGVVGSMSSSEGMKPQPKAVTPTLAGFTVSPDPEYNCLSQVVVKPIPYVESDNPAGGKTATIG